MLLNTWPDREGKGPGGRNHNIAIQHPPATAGFDGEHSHNVNYVLDGGPTLQPRQRCRLTQQLLGAHY
eukprot:5550367-Lingulodinium_polyedra.AAC.1